MIRLLNTVNLCLEEHVGSRVPPYAILSHTWSESEVLYHDVQSQAVLPAPKTGWSKVQYACREALRRGYHHIWIDSCCINKDSSAETQEAINSMYEWYTRAAECFCFLSDLGAECPALADVPQSDPEIERACQKNEWHRAFSRCVWWTRGWTLQELIAPRNVLFFGSAWNCIGGKASLTHLISAKTAIPVSILNGTQKLSTLSIAKRISWAADRRTSLEEDRAYSLLGLLGVNMPTLYGEGRRAFRRLQEELIKISDDQSLFAWSSRSCTFGCLLAESPDDFARDGDVVVWDRPGAFEMTDQSLHLEAPMLYLEDGDYREYLVVLNCRYADNFDASIALRLGTYDHTGELTSRHFHVAEDGLLCKQSDQIGHEPGRSGRVALVDTEFLGFANTRPIQLSRVIGHRQRKRTFRI